MTIEAAERAIAEIVAGADKLKADSPWRRSTHGFQIVSDARGVCDVSVCEIRTKGYTEAEQVALADYIEALQPRNARTIAEGFAALKAEREEARRECAIAFGIAHEKTELADRSVRRLVEATVPGSIGAFSSRDSWKARAEAAEAEVSTLKAKVAELEGDRDDPEERRERILKTVVPPDNGTVAEVFAAVLKCARAWVPEARIIGNVRAGDIARATAKALAYEAECERLREALADIAASGTAYANATVRRLMEKARAALEGKAHD